MLAMKIVVYLLLANFWSSDCASTRINFVRCGANSFSCSTFTKTNTLAIVYQCNYDDVTLFINQFNSPANIETFTIQNCRNLTITFRCTGENKNIRSLLLKNVQRLTIQTQQYTSHLPTAVYFENISYIEEIPSNAFSQIDRTTHSYGCLIPKKDFWELYFKNVTIDTVQSRGFHMPNDFGNFSWTNVKINRLQTSSVIAKFDKMAKFTVENSEIGVVEYLGFQTTAKTISFKRNKFIDVASSSLNGTASNFEFTNNFVNTLQPHSISMLCTNVHILHNKFEYLKSGAFEKISPGLLEDSGRNFGRLRFIYEFKNNTINYMDAGSLNPDYVAYENVATDMSIQQNKIFCECVNIAWLFPGLGHGYNTRILEPFYETVLNDGNNTCISACDLPLAKAFRLFKNGKCLDDITVDWICDSKNKIDVTTTTKSTSSATAPTKRTSPRTWILSLNSSSIALISIDLVLMTISAFLCVILQ